MLVYKQIVSALKSGLFEKAFLILKTGDRYLSKAEAVRLYVSQNIDPDMTEFLLRQSIHRHWTQRAATSDVADVRVQTFETYRSKFVESEYVTEMLESGRIDRAPLVNRDYGFTNDPRILRFLLDSGEINRMVERNEILNAVPYRERDIKLRYVREFILGGRINWEPYGRRIIDIIGLSSNKIASLAFLNRGPVAKYQIKRGVDLPISAMQGTLMSAMTLSEYRMHLTYFPDDPERDRYILSNTGDEDWHIRLRRMRRETQKKRRRREQEKLEIQKEENKKKHGQGA